MRAPLRINASGSVTLLDDPEASVQQSYSFTLVATDGSDNATQQSVTLTVVDQDLEGPLFTSETSVTIDENSGSSQVVYVATSQDESTVAYSLSDDSDSALSIDTQTGDVTLAENPDYETQDIYSFTLVATDAAGNVSDQLVILDITNLDDTAATITSGDTAAAIDENSGTGQVIYTATADDSADVSDGVTFSLVAGSDAALSIDADTGAVTLNADPDHEIQSEYSFAVVATDAAGNVSQAQSVTLDINNLDDTAATITSGDTAVAIDENSGAGQVIYTATADDSADVSDGVTFSLAAGSDAELSIDAATGAVTLNADPDHETQSQYSFTVKATDAAGNASEQSVTLNINNLDDTAPTITSGDTAEAIVENSGEGQLVYTATSDDSSDINDGTLVYSLSDNSDGEFEIDSSTGEVTFSKNPDYEDDPSSSYNFSVAVTDGIQSSSLEVSLPVINVDEVSPTITSEAEVVIVAADETDPVIYTAVADDSSDISGGVTFSLEDTTEYASADSGSAESTISIPSVEASTQHVYVSSSTKSEDGTQETVVVSYNADANVTGLGIRVHYDSTVLTLSEITDVLTGAASGAQFVISPALAGVDDDTENFDGNADTDKVFVASWASFVGPSWPGTTPTDLFTMTYDIADGATGSSAISFSQTSGMAGYAFDGQTHEVAVSGEAAPIESQLSIDSATGEVTLSGTLDPAVQSDYSFTVTATDTAGNSSDLDVVVDAEQPMVDAAMVFVVDGETPPAPMYQATANIEGASYTITDLTQYPDSGSAESTVSIPSVEASTQHVYVSSSTKSEDGTQETVVVSYNADANVTGLGINVYFDSSTLTLAEISDLLATNLLIAPSVSAVQNDSANADGNADTDKYVTMSWVSFVGASWPGTAPADLLTMTFDIAEDATGSSAITFTSTSTSAGYAFDGQAHEIVVSGGAAASPAELVIDDAAGTVSFGATPNDELQADYSLSVEATDADGNAIGSQVVPVVVVDQIVNADASSYTGTADEDVFALADGSAEITSDAGEDEFIVDPAYASAAHTITDFESGVDTIHIGAALVAAGYTTDNAPTQLLGADMSADILDLVNGDDSSLDNLFGATYDDASNTLTVFADTDSSAGATDMESFQITLDDSATVEDDDIVANLSPFIA
jgi:hypothetical protein